MFEQKFFFLHAFIFYPLPKRLHFQSISYTILLMELKGNLKSIFKTMTNRSLSSRVQKCDK